MPLEPIGIELRPHIQTKWHKGLDSLWSHYPTAYTVAKDWRSSWNTRRLPYGTPSDSQREESLGWCCEWYGQLTEKGKIE
eukprot:3509958-Amphidinium_carterae.1